MAELRRPKKVNIVEVRIDGKLVERNNIESNKSHKIPEQKRNSPHPFDVKIERDLTVKLNINSKIMVQILV